MTFRHLYGLHLIIWRFGNVAFLEWDMIAVNLAVFDLNDLPRCAYYAFDEGLVFSVTLKLELLGWIEDDYFSDRRRTEMIGDFFHNQAIANF